MNNMTFMLFLGMMVVMTFVMQGKQKKQAQQRQDELKNLAKGDRVVTIGGLHADVDSVDLDQNLVVLDADGIYLTFDLASIRTVAKAEPTPTAEESTIAREVAVQE